MAFRIIDRDKVPTEIEMLENWRDTLYDATLTMEYFTAVEDRPKDVTDAISWVREIEYAINKRIDLMYQAKGK